MWAALETVGEHPPTASESAEAVDAALQQFAQGARPTLKTCNGRRREARSQAGQMEGRTAVRATESYRRRPHPG